MLKEAEIQTEFFKIIRDANFLHAYPEAKFIHAIPNGARVNIGQAVKLKKQGLLSGVPDVFVPLPTFDHHGLYIEFKVPRGKLSQAQKEFSYHCDDYSYLHLVCYSARDAVAAVRKYLRHTRPEIR